MLVGPVTLGVATVARVGVVARVQMWGSEAPMGCGGVRGLPGD